MVATGSGQGSGLPHYVARTLSCQGALAEYELRKFNWVEEVYSPRIPDETGTRMEALFPRYLIVGCDADRYCFSKINKTRGVERLLPMHLEDAGALPGGYVERLKQQVADMTVLNDLEETAREFNVGELVEIRYGEHAAISGSYQYRKKGAAMILIALLGREHVVSVPLQNISALFENNKNRTTAPQYGRRGTRQYPRFSSAT